MVLSKLCAFEDEKLCGRVFVYSKYRNVSSEEKTINWQSIGEQIIPANETHVLARYSTIFAADMIDDSVKDSEEVKNKLCELEAKAAEVHKKECTESCPEFFHPFHRAVIAPSEQSILRQRCDVMYVGLFENPILCWEAMKTGDYLYFVHVREQIENSFRKLNLPIEDLCRIDFPDKNIVDYVNNRYIRLLVYSKKENDDVLKHISQNRFKAFSKGSEFDEDVKDLCEFIDTNWSAIHEYIINLWVNKISAIHEERYEVAGRLRDEISALKKGVLP